MQVAETFDIVSIRYEGRDADRHTLDLNQLGASIQGFARILAVCAHFVETGRYNKQFDSLAVKVMAQAPDEHRCYEVWAKITSALSSGNLWSGAGGTVLGAVISYVLSRRDQQEMKLLKDALDKSLANQAQTTEKLIATIEKMADALNPSARMALTPVGRSCESVDVYEGSRKIVSADSSLKEHFNRTNTGKFDATRKYTGLISEMDLRTGGCKVSLENDDNRIAAEITDPIRAAPNNPYATAFAAQVPLSFMAKAELDDDGAIAKLYISDLA